MSKTTMITPGLYLINGSADGDGLEYSATRVNDGWVVQDARGRVVSWHSTKADAIKSVEVTP